jgi:hypothetical protein
MRGWPQTTEPLLRERQAMSNERFLEYLAGLLEALGARELDDELYERSVAYPWERPPGSCFVTDHGVENLSGMDAVRRESLVDRYAADSTERVPLLAYGANGSPERLSLKLAHLPDGHREALILAGDLADFDVGVAAQPPVWSSMPATLVPSPGTEVRVAVLFLTPVQFTALWWTELSYVVGALTGVELTTDVSEVPIDHVIAFVSRYGAFCVDGEPVVLSAIGARNRRYAPLTQEQVLGVAAPLVLDDRAGARDLVKAAFESPAAFFAEHYPAFRAASMPFASELWSELPV